MAYGSDLRIDLTATGVIDAWISHLSIRASFDGEIDVSGRVLVDRLAHDLTSYGWFLGEGVRDIRTLMSEGWVAVFSSGSTEIGETWEIRIFLQAERRGLLPLRKGDLLAGGHLTLVMLGDRVHAFAGEFRGTLEGSLESAPPPLLLRLAGTGAFHLEGDAVEPGWMVLPPLALPEAPHGISAAFAELLAELFPFDSPLLGDEAGR